LWIRQPRVFVLDDQPIVAESLAAVLNASGYETHCRYKPTDILDLATELTPDLLISDVALGPNTINGFDLAIYFERFFPDCRSILISGDPNTADLHDRVRRSGHEFLLLQKPIHPETLMRYVNDALQHLRNAA
jgi:DNA-binding NtrC family response regulator